MQCDRPTSSRVAFTLIELLVVVGVLLVLAAIILPTFSRAGWSARTDTCLTNSRQIALALQTYAADENGYLPKIINGAKRDRLGHLLSWRLSLMPYLKSTSVWQCPSNPAGAHRSPDDGIFQSYDVVDCGPIQRNRFVRRSEIPSPATTILVMEENGFNGEAARPGVRWNFDPGYDTWTNILFAGHAVGGRAGRSVFLFADGHAKLMKPFDTIVNGLNMWNLSNSAPVTPRALAKLQAARKNFQ